MSPATLELALEAMRAELVEAEQWHQHARVNIVKAAELGAAAVTSEHDAAEQVDRMRDAIAELEQLQLDSVPMGADIADAELEGEQ